MIRFMHNGYRIVIPYKIREITDFQPFDDFICYTNNGSEFIFSHDFDSGDKKMTTNFFLSRVHCNCSIKFPVAWGWLYNFNLFDEFDFIADKKQSLIILKRPNYKTIKKPKPFICKMVNNRFYMPSCLRKLAQIQKGYKFIIRDNNIFIISDNSVPPEHKVVEHNFFSIPKSILNDFSLENVISITFDNGKIAIKKALKGDCIDVLREKFTKKIHKKIS